MKLTKEKLRLIIKEEIEKLDLDEAGISIPGISTSQGARRKGRPMPSPAPSVAASPAKSTKSRKSRMFDKPSGEVPEEPTGPVGGATTVEIGAAEDLKQRLDQFIDQKGMNITGPVRTAWRMLHKALEQEGIPGEFMQARGTSASRRKTARLAGSGTGQYGAMRENPKKPIAKK